MAPKLIAPDQLALKGITIKADQRSNLEAEGRFPKRIPLTARTYAYIESEIDAWLAERVAAARTAEVVSA